ncbi:MAG: lytic transglycosylase domain-containing protein [Pseudomonadota bacterium]|nr:lytic transglycosylase domain-containing protein [Pseudomonadota bacterium]
MTASAHMAALAQGIKTFAGDVAEGFFEITHNSLALLGVLVVLAVAVLGTRPDLREQGEQRLTAWLTARQVAAMGITPEPDAIDRATAANPRDLPREQASLALWIARKYRVAPEPVAALVAEAYEVGRANKLDPTLILAVMAIESSFNPFAQSPVGAQGLMQVMTEIHSDKYAHFGGQYAAFDPKSNLRVGVKILKEYITRTGSVEGGLKWYVGAANLPSDGGYASKVLAEHARLQRVARGQNVSPQDNTPWLRAAAPSPAPTLSAAPTAPAAPALPGAPAAQPANSPAVNVAAL